MERARSIIAYLTDLFRTHSLDRDKYRHLAHILILHFSLSTQQYRWPIITHTWFLWEDFNFTMKLSRGTDAMWWKQAPSLFLTTSHGRVICNMDARRCRAYLAERWGWVVTFASFCMHFVCFGIYYCFSITFIALQEEFETSSTATCKLAGPIILRI